MIYTISFELDDGRRGFMHVKTSRGEPAAIEAAVQKICLTMNKREDQITVDTVESHRRVVIPHEETEFLNAFKKTSGL